MSDAILFSNLEAVRPFDKKDIIEMPLDVRVAAAFGWILFHPRTKIVVQNWMTRQQPYTQTMGERCGGWSGIPPNTPEHHFVPPESRAHAGPGHAVAIPKWSTDWSITGPLIDKYHIDIEENDSQPEQGPWRFIASGPGGAYENGHTRLEAACELLVTLGERGKL